MNVTKYSYKRNFLQISAGDFHTVHEISIKIECWGFNASWQSTPPSGTFTDISLGTAHCFGDTTEQVQCWGDNTYGQTDSPTGDS